MTDVRKFQDVRGGTDREAKPVEEFMAELEAIQATVCAHAQPRVGARRRRHAVARVPASASARSTTSSASGTRRSSARWWPTRPTPTPLDLEASEHFSHWIQNLADETGYAGDRNHVDMKVEWARMLGISDEELAAYVPMPETLGMVLGSCTTCAGPTRRGWPPSAGPASASPRRPATPR